MTKEEAAIVAAYTGVLIGDFGDMHQYIEDKLERPVFTHEMGSESFMSELKEACREDFINITVGEML